MQMEHHCLLEELMILVYFRPCAYGSSADG
jgi:hypothetical protein